MNAFESLDGFSRIWGNWMLQMTWQVGLLVLILSLLTLVWRQKSAVLLHTLWLLVLVRLVLPPTFAFPTGWAFWLLPATNTAHTVQPQIEATRPVIARLSEDHAESSAVKNSYESTRNGAGQFESDSVKPDASSSTAGTLPLAASRNEQTTEKRDASAASSVSLPMRTWASYLLLAWAGVTGTLLGLLFWGSMRVRQWVREAEPIDDPDLYSMLADCRARLAMTRLVELRNSEACSTPVVVGVRRPVILLPKAVLTQLSRAEMRTVLLHELNHIARGDAIVNLLQGVLGSVYFFHPLVWWANASLRRLREEACDELTVAALDGERRTYGEALVKVTEIFGYASPPLALGVLESKSPARARLSRILDPQLPQGSPHSWRTRLATLVLGALLLPGAGGRSSAAQNVETSQELVENDNLRIDDSKSRADVVADTNDMPTEVTSETSTVGQGEDANSKNPESTATTAIVAVAEGALRYRWQAGKSYAYSIQIEADSGETIELLSGTPVYMVRSTGPEGTELVFNGRLMPMQKFKPGRRIPFGRPPHFRGPFSAFGGVGIHAFPPTEHVLHVDNRGGLQSQRGDSQLPYVLGNLSQLVLPPLPRESIDHWEESCKTAVTLKSDDSRFPRFGFGRFADRDDGTHLDASEKAEYTVIESQPNAVIIRKKYELKTTETLDGQPRVELTGQADFTFDLGLGLPKSMSGKFKLTNATENVTHRIPITISAKLLNEEERARLEGDQKPAISRQPVDDEVIDEVLEDLKASEPFRVQNAADRLEKAEPSARQFEVARALEPFMKSQDNVTRQAAARALAVWGTTESVPALIEALQDELFAVRALALTGLGKIGDERAIEPTIGLLRTERNRLEAIAALENIGVPAEVAVLKLLEEANSNVRYDACRILTTMGTDKSLALLEKQARDDDNNLVRLVAAQAATEIRSRQK